MYRLGAKISSTPESNSLDVGLNCLEPGKIASVFPNITRHNNRCLKPFSSPAEDNALRKDKLEYGRPMNTKLN